MNQTNNKTIMKANFITFVRGLKNGISPQFQSYLKSLTLLLVMVMSVNLMAESYTITFATGSGDGTKASTSTACSTVVSEGSDYLSGNLETATNVYYGGGSGLKLGTSNNAGTLKMNLSNAGKVTPTSIVVRAKQYNSSNATKIALNGQTAQSLTSDFKDYTFDITSAITYLEINSSKGTSGKPYCWIESITVNYAAATKCEDPKISVAGGTYTEAKSVTLSCTTKDAAIHYTTDGSTPTSSSPTYSSAINVNQDMTIKAIATKNGLDNSEVVSAAYVINYKVTFNKNGHGTAPSAITPIKYNASISDKKPADLSETGYTFGGWYKEQGCTNAWDWTNDKITSNTTLYAKWTANKYNLTFEKNDEGASSLMAPQEFTFNVAQNLNSNTFTAPAHKYFTGWATTSGGSKAYNNGASYTMTTEGATLYAVWAWKKTTITLNKDGGTGGSSSVTATYGSAMPSAGAVPTKTGYDFNGYYTGQNGTGTQYYNSTNASVQNWDKDDASLTLYAYWTPKNITITLAANGHSDTNGSFTIVYGTKVATAFTAVTPHTGYTVRGYYTTTAGSGAVVINPDGTLGNALNNWIDADGNWIKATNETLYACYTPDKHTVKWMVSGNPWTGKGGSTKADYDSRVANVPTTVPTTSDCDFMKEFVGWTATEIDGTTDTKPSDLFTDAANAPIIKGDAIYYAVFALPEESTTDYAKGTLDDLQTGKKVLILSESTQGDALSSEVGNSTGYLKIEKTTITNGVISNPKNTIIWNVTKSADKYSFDQGSDKILNMTSDANMYANSTSDTWTITLIGETTYRMKSTNGGANFDRYNDNGFKGWSNEGNSNKVDFYLPATTYSEYATTCVECTNVITISKGEEVEHGSYNLSKTGDVCLSNIQGGTYSVTVTATPDEHYHLATVTTSSGTAGEVVDNTCVVSGITANTTLTAVFEEDPNVTVTWHIGAGEKTTSNVYVGSTYSLLKSPIVNDDDADDCADKFMGWATEAINGSTGVDKNAVAWVTDDYVIDDDHKDIYAVFASKVGEELTSIEFSLTSISGITATAAQRTQITNGITFTFSSVSDNNTSGVHSVQISKNANLTQDKAFVGNISSITFTDFAYSSTSNAAMTITGCSTIDGTYGSVASLDGSYKGTEIDFSGKNYKCFKLEVGSERTVKFKTMTVNYMDVSYGNYITQCCTPWAPTLSYANTTMQVGEEQDAVVGTLHGTATYTSSNPSSVEVNETTGHIKAVGGGTATISVTWTGDDTYCEQSTTSQEITVNGSLQVTFNGNGADGGTAMEPQMVEYGQAENLNKNTYTKTGYTFQGWATSSTATSINYTDEQSVTLTAGVELFAVWSINAHKVTIQDATGGTIAISPTATTIDYNTTVTATATLTPGYNFVSWSATPAVTFADATNKSTTFSMPDNDVRLTASYTPILVTKIDLKKGSDDVTALEFEKGVTDPVTLTTAFTPADALDKTVTWYSGNTNVVTAVNGILTAQGLGTAVVTAASTAVPSVYGSVTVTVYEWQDADPKYTLTNQPASVVYYETNKIDFANWTIQHNFKRSDDATKTKQEEVASSNWIVTLGGDVISNNYTLTTADNGKVLVIKVGETDLYNQTLTVNEKAKHTYIDRVHGNEDKVMMDTYTIPSLSNTSAATEGDCATTHYVFKGWVAEANADAPNDDNLIAAGGSATAEADATFYAVWAEHKMVTKDLTMFYGWETTGSTSGWKTTASSTTAGYHSGSKSGTLGSACTAIETTNKIVAPKSLTYYARKASGNSESKQYIVLQYSSNGSNFNEIAEGKVTNSTLQNDNTKWTEMKVDLTAETYKNQYFRIHKEGGATQYIDDVTLIYEGEVEADVDYITECVTRYELTFDANGGTGTVPEAIMLKEGGKINLPNADLTKAYNNFSGWNTDAAGNGTSYAVGAEYTMGTEPTTLYAKWTPRKVETLTITSEATNKEFGIGQTFNADGLKVKATYEGGETESNVEFTTNFDGHVFTEQETGTQTVTVSYKGFNADLYTVTVAPALMVRFYVNGQMIQEKPVFDKKIGAMPNAMTTWNEITGNEARPDLFPIFAGWIIGNNLTDNPTFVSDATEIEGDVNVHAVFAHAVTPDLENKTLATSIDPSKRYVIVDGDNYYKGEASNDWGVVDAEDAEIITFCGKSDMYALQQADGNYINTPKYNTSSDHKFYLSEEPVHSFKMVMVTKENVDYYGLQATNTEEYLRNNSSNANCLRWYNNGTPAQLYSVDVTYDQLTLIPYGMSIRKNLSNGKIGSMCQNREILAVAGGHLYQPNYVNGYTLEFIEVKYPVEAGMPLIYQTDGTNDGNLAVIYGSKEIVTKALEGDQTRGMVGYIGEGTMDVLNYSESNKNYVFQNNKLYQANQNYLTNDRAYINLGVVQELGPVKEESTATPRRRLSMGVPHSTATNLNELLEQDTKQCIKFIRDNKLFILREGKIYDATGKKIK